MYYLNLFFVYSMIGFLFESVFITMGNNIFNSGILFGPWTPVYGVGAIIIVLIHKWLDKHFKNVILKGFLLFFFCAIILTILEWCGGMLIEEIFNKVYWSYENMKFNFGHYIALEISAIWGIASIVLIYLANPLLEKIVKRIPKWLIYILTGLFLVDLVVTLIIK